MSENIHPLVKAEVMHLAAKAEKTLQEVRSQRESVSSSTAGGQSRALTLGRRITELTKIAESWSRIAESMGKPSPALALMVGEPEGDGSGEILGWLHKDSGAMRCNTNSHCRGWATETGAHGSGCLIPLTRASFPGGNPYVCSVCDLDVLA
jgi:hypothetical protein